MDSQNKTKDSSGFLTIGEVEEAIRKSEQELNDLELRQLEVRLGELSASSALARQVTLAGPIGPELAQALITTFHKWQRQPNGPKTVLININSEGERDRLGDHFTNTFALFDAVRMLKQAGFKVVMQVTGVAGVQAVSLLQAADERYISPESWLLLSEASFPGFQGNSAEMRDMIDFRKSLEEQSRAILLGRSKVTKEQLHEKTRYERLWWVPAAEATELQLVDQVGVFTQPGPSLAHLNVPLVEGEPAKLRRAKTKLRTNLLRAHVRGLETQALEAETANPRLIYFFDVVETSSCLVTGEGLQQFARIPGSKIEIVLNSPGGSVHDGLGLMNQIEQVRKQGHEVTIRVLGYAASMAGFILQSADRRIIGKNSRILIHRISRIFGGSASQLEDQRDQMKRLEEQALPKLAQRSKLSVDDILKRSEHKDWWLTADEALELGFVDEVF